MGEASGDQKLKPAATQPTQITEMGACLLYGTGQGRTLYVCSLSPYTLTLTHAHNFSLFQSKLQT